MKHAPPAPNLILRPLLFPFAPDTVYMPFILVLIILLLILPRHNYVARSMRLVMYLIQSIDERYTK